MFCKQCGNRLEEGARFCNSCGATVVPENNMNQNVNPNMGQPMQQQPMNYGYAQPQTNSNAKLFKILSYFGILFLVGLCGNKENDKSVRFHVGQGIILCISYVAVSIVRVVLSIISYAIFYDAFDGLNIVGRLLTLGGSLLYILVFVVNIIGIVNAIHEEDKELPVIGKFAFYK